MATARPLRDVFAAATGVDPAGSDPGELLRSNGHDLPDDLVAEAVIGYADTAPIEVAEHLAGYVSAHSAVPLTDLPDVDSGRWLDDLSSAPITVVDHLDAEVLRHEFAGHDFAGHDPADLDFTDAAPSHFATDPAADPSDLDLGSTHDDRLDHDRHYDDQLDDVGGDHDAAQAPFGVGDAFTYPLADVDAGPPPHSIVDPIGDSLLGDEPFDEGDCGDGFDDDTIDS